MLKLLLLNYMLKVSKSFNSILSTLFWYVGKISKPW
jgi:hypothetical protein